MSDFIINGELRIEAERLCDENERLETENAKLQEQSERLFDKTLELATENDRFRELVADMLMCLTWQYEPHGYMEDGCNCCRFRGKTHGECGLGMFRGRSSELGVGVDDDREA